MVLSHQDINKIKRTCFQYKRIDYAFLFGSALKRMRVESDIDILLNGKITPAQRIDLSLELEAIVKRKVDIISAQEVSCELALEAFSCGVLLFIRNKENLKKDYFKKFYLYDDTTNLRKIRVQRIKNKYARGQ